MNERVLWDFWEGSLKGIDHPRSTRVGPFLFPAAWSMDAMAGTPAASFDHGVTLSTEATLQDGGAEGLRKPPE